MKRVAERQLTKDNEDADNSQDEDSGGFQMADPASLSERRIRGLPKRALGSTAPASQSPQSSADTAPPPTSRFGAFTGFGNNASSSFTFSANLPTSATPQSTANILGTKPLNGIPSSASPAADNDREEAARKYCLNLRGLNISFLGAITKAVDADPMVDISVMLEEYTKIRSTLKKDFTNTANSTKFSFGFSGSANTTSASSTYKPDSTKASLSTSIPGTVSSTLFDNKAVSKAPPLFGSVTTGSDTKQSTSLFGRFPQNPTGFLGKSQGFGFEVKSSPSAPLTPGFSAFTAVPSSKSGSSSSPSSFTNITSTGSIGNPVGFGFGSLPTTPSAANSTKILPSTAADEPGKVDDPTVSTPDGTEEESQGAAEGISDATSSAIDVNPYDMGGAGEEGETTIFETKARAYKMTQKGEKAEWQDVGTGQLKLKAHPTGRRRLLMRNSSTGKVILNFSLYTGFKTAHQTAKSFSFRVPGKGASATVFSVRVATPDDAAKWQKTVQDEVDALAS